MTDMLNAFENDMESLERGEPGLAKLQLLPRVEEQISKQSLQDSFIDAGGLSAIREWLRLLPDSSLPNYTLRTSLLRMLSKLTPSITIDNLKESKVGHSLCDIIFHKDESVANQRIANEIAETWLRRIYGRTEPLVPKLGEEETRTSTFKVQPVARVQRVKPAAPTGAYGERISKAVQQRHVKKSTGTKVSVEGRGL